MALLNYFGSIPGCIYNTSGVKEIVLPNSLSSTNVLLKITLHAMLSGSLVTTAWRVLGLQMEDTASRYGE
jgi:hypothetical protein